MSKIVTCPSGLSGEVRGITGKSFELLNNKALHRTGKFTGKLLDACWTSTSDPGPYAPDDDGKLDWDKVLAGDRFYAVMQVRIAMYGPLYDFSVRCKAKDCKHMFRWEGLNLEELPVKKFAEADLNAFKNGNVHEGVLPDGRKFRFKLATGTEEAKIAQLVDKQDAFNQAMVARLHSVDGVTGTLRSFFEQQEISVHFAMLREMDKHDGGVDTTVEVVCPKCDYLFQADVPFDEGFLVPSRNRTTAKNLEQIQEADKS